MTNDDLAQRLETSDAWVRQRTGIGARHWSDGTVVTSDLAVAAGRGALEAAGAGHAGCVVVATTTPDHRCPATAPRVAARLGIEGVPAFDVAAVCTGWLYALITARGLIRGGLVDSVLVIGAETYSTILDPLDRTTSVIFGDGAGAALVCCGDPEEPGAVCAEDWGSDGAAWNLIRIPGGGAAAPGDADRYFRMAGRAVYRHAVTHMTASAGRVLERAGWARPEAFIGHQANQRILDAVAERVGVDASACVGNLAEVGNTAAASIPLAMAHGVREGLVKAGARTVLTAFGGGLTWGSVALRWPQTSAVQVPAVPCGGASRKENAG